MQSFIKIGFTTKYFLVFTFTCILFSSVSAQQMQRCIYYKCRDNDGKKLVKSSHIHVVLCTNSDCKDYKKYTLKYSFSGKPLTGNKHTLRCDDRDCKDYGTGKFVLTYSAEDHRPYNNNKHTYQCKNRDCKDYGKFVLTYSAEDHRPFNNNKHTYQCEERDCKDYGRFVMMYSEDRHPLVGTKHSYRCDLRSCKYYNKYVIITDDKGNGRRNHIHVLS